MLSRFACCSLFFAAAFAIPVEFSKLVKNDEKAEKLDEKAFSFALDLAPTAVLTVSQFQCIRQAGYMTVFLRAYMPTGTGQADNNGIRSVTNAFSAGLGTEVYATPQPMGSKTGSQQFDEAYSALTGAGVNVRALWLLVTSPANWPQNVNTNVNFISSWITRSRSRGVAVGIYSNWYDWQQITGNWMSAQSGGAVSLWYWNTYGQGVSGESPSDFSDFRTFGGWSQPAVKQFGVVESVCSITVNRNVYVTGTKTVEKNTVESKEPVVGLLIGQ